MNTAGRFFTAARSPGLRGVERSRTREFLFGGDHAARPRAPPAAGLAEASGRHAQQSARTRRSIFRWACSRRVTGVSGSGKSSLVSQALVELVAGALGQEAAPPDEEEEGEPLEHAPRATDGRKDHQRHGRRAAAGRGGPEGRSAAPRARTSPRTPGCSITCARFSRKPRRRAPDATTRAAFRSTSPRAVARRVRAKGSVMVELLFLASVYSPCPTCHGARYNAKTLEVKFRDKNIAEVLGLTVDDACDFFADQPTLLRSLDVLRQVGLGYLRLGSARHGAFRRRGATHQAGHRIAARRARPDTLRAR